MSVVGRCFGLNKIKVHVALVHQKVMVSVIGQLTPQCTSKHDRQVKKNHNKTNNPRINN